MKIIHSKQLEISLALSLLYSGAVMPADGPASNITGNVDLQEDARAVEEYWTPERMRTAVPLELPQGTGASLPTGVTTHTLSSDPPGYAPGWDPRSGKPQPSADTAVEVELDALQGAATSPKLDDTMHGPAPTNPAGTAYPPFQRWTWNANYTVYPVGTIGKLFFTKATGGNFVCSASVIQRSTLVTAGHCVSQGNGVFHNNFLFCPSYWKGAGSGAPNGVRGCWPGVGVVTTWQWHNVANTDRDYACIVTANAGTVQNQPVGNVTGWLGRAWNWPSSKAEMAFGYPAASPFQGYHIITASSTEWYTSNRSNANEGAVNLVSKYIGSDMTGGSSGGPWILGFNHKNKEYPDTDGESVTDSGNNWVNGVNSHKRCKNACFTPPNAAAGTYWQEMGSPRFTNNPADNNDSEDVFNVCFTNGGAT